jgi:pimeloyl-ACP methyl ester carboxylesterase
MGTATTETPLAIDVGGVTLQGDLALPPDATGLVVFAHGSGSSRHSPRNRHVAGQLQSAGLGTLLFDLLTLREEAIDERTAELRFDIELLAGRLVSVTDWLALDDRTKGLSIGYFGASTGAAAALIAAAERPASVRAVVSRGGRPDLAARSLPRVQAATLLIVGSRDHVVIELNKEALQALRCVRRLELVPGATHLFEEPGTLDEVAGLARDWFIANL